MTTPSQSTDDLVKRARLRADREAVRKTDSEGGRGVINMQLLNELADTIERLQREKQEQAKTIEALREDARPFPMQKGPPIPWSLARIIYAGYSAEFGTDQSLERLAERRGFSWAEVEVIYKMPRARAAIDAARSEGAAHE